MVRRTGAAIVAFLLACASLFVAETADAYSPSEAEFCAGRTIAPFPDRMFDGYCGIFLDQVAVDEGETFEARFYGEPNVRVDFVLDVEDSAGTWGPAPVQRFEVNTDENGVDTVEVRAPVQEEGSGSTSIRIRAADHVDDGQTYVAAILQLRSARAYGYATSYRTSERDFYIGSVTRAIPGDRFNIQLRVGNQWVDAPPGNLEPGDLPWLSPDTATGIANSYGEAHLVFDLPTGAMPGESYEVRAYNLSKSVAGPVAYDLFYIEFPPPCVIRVPNGPASGFEGQLRLRGRIDKCPAETLTVEAKIGGAWTVVGQTPLSRQSGDWGMVLSQTLKAGIYDMRVVVGSTTSTAFQYRVFGQPIVQSAGLKQVGVDTYAWGTVPYAWQGTTVETQVYVPGRGWSSSQRAYTSATGHFAIPLTYGKSALGTYRWRVKADPTGYDPGFSSEFTLRRVARPTASSAGSAPIGRVANVWGTVDAGAGATVWTEVLLNGKWLKSQQRTANSSGWYVIPLTYGSNTRGVYTWRVAARLSNGEIVRSNDFYFFRY